MLLRSLSLFGAQSGIVVLTIYVDDILLTESDSVRILETKKYLKRHFVTKDMRRPKYFLGIELRIKNIVYFFFNESMLWIIWRRHDFWGASLLALQ